MHWQKITFIEKYFFLLQKISLPISLRHFINIVLIGIETVFLEVSMCQISMLFYI